jgi:hypothetical protein
MLRALLDLAADTIALPLDIAMDTAQRVVDPNPRSQPTRTERRIERIEEDLGLDE